MDKEEYSKYLEEYDLEENDAAELKGNLPEKPGFPFLMFALGLTKDIIDACDAVGIIGAIINVVIVIIFFFYFWKHSIGSSDKKVARSVAKSLKKKIMKRYAGAGICEFIPLLNLVPFYSLLVYFVYKKENEGVNKIISFYDAFEKFGKSGKMKTLSKIIK